MRRSEAERFRRLQVDHQLELGRLLDRKVAGLGALEDLSGIYAELIKDSCEASSIAD